MNWLPVSVGQGPTIVQQGGQVALGAADAYTYGAASQALSEGQAMQAWAELAKAQNYPAVKTSSLGGNYHKWCPSGFLISPGGNTCVNKEGTHVYLTQLVEGGEALTPWWAKSPVVLYMQLHDPGALGTGGTFTYDVVASAFLKAIRELGMTTGVTGWANVKSHARAVAHMLVFNAHSEELDQSDVGSVTDKILSRISGYYDADVKAAKSGSMRRFTPIGPAEGSGGLLLFTALGAGALYYFKPALAKSLLSKGTGAGKSLISKARGMVGR